MTGADAINSSSNPYYLQLQQLLAGGSSGASATSTASAQGGSSVSADISPAGQLLSNLQQLQTQDPTQFKQVVSQIADQLSSAAQQQGQNGTGSFLTNLADKFQNVANGGDISQLQPQGAHHHHGHHGGHSSYNSAGQGVSSASTPGADTTATTLQQLFANINSEVTQALAS